jgi:hypothetical protein
MPFFSFIIVAPVCNASVTLSWRYIGFCTLDQGRTIGGQ